MHRRRDVAWSPLSAVPSAGDVTPSQSCQVLRICICSEERAAGPLRVRFFSWCGTVKQVIIHLFGLA